MKQVAAPQSKEKEDRGLFLQLPFILIDTVEMSDSAMVGFIRFCRSYLQKDKTINYHGSYRLLAKDIKQARMTCYRSVEHWIKSELVTMTETPDEFILTGNLSFLWEKNANHCKTHQRPKFNTSASQIETQSNSTMSQNNLNSVPNLNATIPNRDENGKNWDTNERKTAPIDTIDTLLDTRERENGNFADRSLPCLHPFLSIDLTSENVDLDTILCEDFAYSQHQPQPTTLQASLETRSTAVGAGYTTSEETVKPPEKPVKGTKRTKKERVVQPALVDTSKKAVAYNEAEQQQFDWYCGLDFIHARPEQDTNKKAHCGKLIAHVHSQEDMQSLADFTKARLRALLNRDVYIAQLGNMANGDNLNAWIASKQTPQQAGKVIDFQQKTTQQHVRASSPNTAGFQPLSDEDRKRNYERLLAKRNAQLAAQQASPAAM